MADPWSALALVLQLWIFMVLFLIMLPAMFGLSLGVTGVYIRVLVRILEVPPARGGSVRVCVCVCVRSGVRGQMKTCVSAVGNDPYPEGKAGAAQHTCPPVHR